MTEPSKQNWNAGIYDKNYSFVFKYGEDILNLLAPQKGERILDLGCGTGHLTKIISDSGAMVTGIDSSAEMIEKARINYPCLDFAVKDATDFSFEEKFDSVFSNATLHWIKDQEKLLICVFDSLKKGGKFTAEFGGKNNIKRVETALRNELRKNGFISNAELDLWFYPSVAEYSTILEEIGFTVSYVSYFKRDTLLKEGDDISGWLEMFCKPFFKNVDSPLKLRMVENIQNNLKATNYKDGKWFIDYIRLRFTAIKD